ncbi:hypothetical protein AOQ84DRAFT_403877, partial [Glonium stellatum]
MAPHSDSIPTSSASFPPSPPHEPAQFSTAHTQPPTSVMETQSHHSTEPPHGPPLGTRREPEMEGKEGKGKGKGKGDGSGGEKEVTSETTKPVPSPRTATRGAVRKLDTTAAVKVTTHHGPTPSCEAGGAVDPSCDGTKPATLQQMSSEGVEGGRAQGQQAQWRGDGEGEREEKNTDDIFHAIGPVPNTPCTRPLRPLHPPTSPLQTTLKAESLTALSITLSTNLLTTHTSATTLQDRRTPPPSPSLPTTSTPPTPFTFPFDLPPFPPLLFGVIVAALIAGAVAAVVLYWVNFPPGWLQTERRKGEGWMEVESESVSSGTSTAAEVVEVNGVKGSGRVRERVRS